MKKQGTETPHNSAMIDRGGANGVKERIVPPARRNGVFVRLCLFFICAT
jgi:hypothetical protein